MFWKTKKPHAAERTALESLRDAVESLARMANAFAVTPESRVECETSLCDDGATLVLDVDGHRIVVTDNRAEAPLTHGLLEPDRFHVRDGRSETDTDGASLAARLTHTEGSRTR